jgi:hypothetical protein
VSSLNGLERYLKSRAPDPDDASPSLAIDPARWYRPPPQRQLRSILSHGPRVAVPRACAGHGAGDRHAHGRADLVGGLVAGLVVGLRVRHGGLVGGLRQVRTCARAEARARQVNACGFSGRTRQGGGALLQVARSCTQIRPDASSRTRMPGARAAWRGARTRLHPGVGRVASSDGECRHCQV